MLTLINRCQRRIKKKMKNEILSMTPLSLYCICAICIYDNTLQRCNAHGIVLFYKYEFTTSNDI